MVLANNGKYTFQVNRGAKIAQMIIHKCEKPSMIILDTDPMRLDPTNRGASGFGSTGLY